MRKSIKIAVYSAVFGAKDTLRAPLGYFEKEHVDYFVFSDQKSLEVHPYRLIEGKTNFNDIAKNARFYKILGDDCFKPYDVVIWHDANIQLQHDEIESLIEKSSETYLTTFAHPNRNDFYSEAMTCIRVDKDFSLRILKQAWNYFLNGMPAHNGMYSTGILVKNNCFKPLQLMELWWSHTLKYSRRDQLSLAYAIYKTNSKITVLEDNIFDNKYSKYHPHIYNHYKESRSIMKYNYKFLKKLSFFAVKIMRKIKKGI